MKIVALLSLLTAAACGASDHTTPMADAVDGGADDIIQGVTGTVWAPGNAPGMVPVGHEIPVSGAMVYLGSQKPDPIPQEAQCIPCTEAPPNAYITDAKGTFQLRAEPGTYWLVVQKAHFRIEQQIVVGEGAQLLTPAMTTLPSVHDPDGGKWMPRIAMAASDGYDAMETVFGKMGIGQVSAAGEFNPSSATGRFDVYANGGGELDYVAIGDLRDLVGSLEKMMSYHIIFIPCSTWSNGEMLLEEPILRNIRDYVAAGGRLYVTDWSGEWADNVFPEQIQLGPDADTPATAYVRAEDRWVTEEFGPSDDSPPWSSPDAEAADPDLAAWLEGQVAPDGFAIDAQAFHVEGNWNRIMELHDVVIGTDEEGEPVVDKPRLYVRGSEEFDGAGKRPLTATYEPAGCGRVMYSTYHTTDSVHAGLLPQERVLLYLMMEIGVSKDDNVVD